MSNIEEQESGNSVHHLTSLSVQEESSSSAKKKIAINAATTRQTAGGYNPIETISEEQDDSNLQDSKWQDAGMYSESPATASV